MNRQPSGLNTQPSGLPPLLNVDGSHVMSQITAKLLPLQEADEDFQTSQFAKKRKAANHQMHQISISRGVVDTRPASLRAQQSRENVVPISVNNVLDFKELFANTDKARGGCLKIDQTTESTQRAPSSEEGVLDDTHAKVDMVYTTRKERKSSYDGVLCRDEVSYERRLSVADEILLSTEFADLQLAFSSLPQKTLSSSRMGGVLNGTNVREMLGRTLQIPFMPAAVASAQLVQGGVYIPGNGGMPVYTPPCALGEKCVGYSRLQVPAHMTARDWSGFILMGFMYPGEWLEFLASGTPPIGKRNCILCQRWIELTIIMHSRRVAGVDTKETCGNMMLLQGYREVCGVGGYDPSHALKSIPDVWEGFHGSLIGLRPHALIPVKDKTGNFWRVDQSGLLYKTVPHQGTDNHDVARGRGRSPLDQGLRYNSETGEYKSVDVKQRGGDTGTPPHRHTR